MRALAVAVIIASLTVPAAYAQDPSKEQSNREATEKKKEADAIEKAYKEAEKRLPPPPPPVKHDPWHNIR